MKIPLKRIRPDGEPREAPEDIGGEPLEGSGFEHETPEPEFTDSEHRAPLPEN